MKKFFCLVAILSLVCIFSSCDKDDNESVFKEISVKVGISNSKKYDMEYALHVTGKKEDLLIDKSEWIESGYQEQHEITTFKLKKKSINEVTFDFKAKNSSFIFYVSSKKEGTEESVNMHGLIDVKINGQTVKDQFMDNVPISRISFHVD